MRLEITHIHAERGERIYLVEDVEEFELRADSLGDLELRAHGERDEDFFALGR